MAEDHLEGYKLEKKLGEGSFASVWKGRDIQTREAIAIKVISRPRAEKPRQFQQEVAALQRIKHENIVKCLGIKETAAHYYLLLEYCDGGDLSRHLRNSKQLDEATAQNYVRQIARGLRIIHRQNIMHRDLKPQNILLSSKKGGYQLKIADFGFSRAIQSLNDMAATICGSPYYMAPEVLQFKPYNLQADLWSIGVMLYEMLFGKLPFEGSDSLDLLHNIETLNSIQIPEDTRVSPSCLHLLHRLLTINQVERITSEGFFKHPFVDIPVDEPYELDSTVNDPAVPDWKYQQVDEQPTKQGNRNSLISKLHNVIRSSMSFKELLKIHEGPLLFRRKTSDQLMRLETYRREESDPSCLEPNIIELPDQSCVFDGVFLDRDDESRIEEFVVVPEAVCVVPDSKLRFYGQNAAAMLEGKSCNLSFNRYDRSSLQQDATSARGDKASVNAVEEAPAVCNSPQGTTDVLPQVGLRDSLANMKETKQMELMNNSNTAENNLQNFESSASSLRGIPPLFADAPRYVGNLVATAVELSHLAEEHALGSIVPSAQYPFQVCSTSQPDGKTSLNEYNEAGRISNNQLEKTEGVQENIPHESLCTTPFVNAFGLILKASEMFCKAIEATCDTRQLTALKAAYDSCLVLARWCEDRISNVPPGAPGYSRYPKPLSFTFLDTPNALNLNPFPISNHDLCRYTHRAGIYKYTGEPSHVRCTSSREKQEDLSTSSPQRCTLTLHQDTRIGCNAAALIYQRILRLIALGATSSLHKDYKEAFKSFYTSKLLMQFLEVDGAESEFLEHAFTKLKVICNYFES